ncbi:hypothetical protein O181_044459 [Austropuccinia psidii MF-1]|uniref:GAG-pre-integrase domain-containing protein n=1 Tax=Austropuccinia psidii MF-1 TaxID=1389203 RepID=A0A9Q3HJF2_9BASI|nr:hypothetical protein [Austropuccinia psidii MF-1]
MNDSTIYTGCYSSSLTAVGKGNARLIHQKIICWTLRNSLYVPKLNTNLVALSQLASQITIELTDENFNVFLNDSTTPSFSCLTKIKVLETRVKLGARCLSTERDKLWNQRLGHLNNNETKALIPTYLASRKIFDDSHTNLHETSTDEDDVFSVWGEEFHVPLEKQTSRRIRVIGPRYQTLITGDVSEENILPY